MPTHRTNSLHQTSGADGSDGMDVGGCTGSKLPDTVDIFLVPIRNPLYR